MKSLGTVFLTGSTGFLGAHILDALLKADAPKVYCLVRENRERLHDRLQYYFAERYTDDDRIVPVNGDLASVAKLEVPESVSLVIHAAGTVKHYGDYKEFNATNVVGTKNIIAFSQRKHAKLIHISTTSVSGIDGFSDTTNSDAQHSFSEEDLYIGQKLDNVYVRSKFQAECAVLDAALDGLPVQIIRVGNLTNRRIDSVFQPNYKSNAFLNRLRAILLLGCLPESFKDRTVEFSPVEEVASAIVLLARAYAPEWIISHVFNHKYLSFQDLLTMLASLGYPVRFVPDQEFVKLVQSANDSGVQKAILPDIDRSGNWLKDTGICIKSNCTVSRLAALGFYWKPFRLHDLELYLQYWKGLGYLP